MPYNGAGVFSLVVGNPVVTGTIISSTVQNNTMSDIVNNGLTNCLTKDGQQTPTANIPLGGFRLTNVANAVNAQDAVTAAQLQSGSTATLSSVSGTDTITANSSPATASYSAEQQFRFIATGANTTAAVTLNINALGAKNVTKFGAIPLAVGDIPNGAVVTVTYDGTQFQITGINEPSSIIGASRDASMVVVAASATATFTAGEVIMAASLGGPTTKFASYSQAVNLATTGAGAMDTGLAPASGYVALYAIYNPTTGTRSIIGQDVTSIVATTVYGGANMPAGYTLSALLIVWPTNASRQFPALTYSSDRTVWFGIAAVLNTNTVQGTPTSVSAAAVIPKNAKRVSGYATLSSTAGSAMQANMFLFSGGGAANQFGGQATATIPISEPFSNVPITTAQTMFYAWSSTAGTPNFVIGVSSYTI